KTARSWTFNLHLLMRPDIQTESRASLSEKHGSLYYADCLAGLRWPCGWSTNGVRLGGARGGVEFSEQPFQVFQPAVRGGFVQPQDLHGGAAVGDRVDGGLLKEALGVWH